MRLVAALGVLLLANMFFPFSKALHLRLHMSIFWKQDFTLLDKTVRYTNINFNTKPHFSDVV